MYKSMRLLFVMVGLFMGYANGMTTCSLQDQKAEVQKSPWSLLQASVHQLKELDVRRTNNEFACRDMMSIQENNNLKNKADQGAVCYKALKLFRELNADDVSTKAAAELVVMQDQLIMLLKHLDEIGKVRLVWCFLADEKKVDNGKESQEAYEKDPCAWCKKFVNKAKTAFDAETMKTLSDCLYYEPNFVATVLESDAARTQFRADYMDALQGYIDWVEGFMGSKEEKTESKAS